MSENPYSAPISDVLPPHRAMGGDEIVTDRIMRAMLETRPWVTFLSVLGFIGAGLSVIAGLVIAVFTPGDAPMGPLIGIIYLIAAGLYAAGSNLLYRYRTSIAAMQRGYGIEALENALEHQKSFWRFTGITTAVMVGLYGVAIVVGIIVAAAS